MLLVFVVAFNLTITALRTGFMMDLTGNLEQPFLWFNCGHLSLLFFKSVPCEIQTIKKDLVKNLSR